LLTLNSGKDKLLNFAAKEEAESSEIFQAVGNRIYYLCMRISAMILHPMNITRDVAETVWKYEIV